MPVMTPSIPVILGNVASVIKTAMNPTKPSAVQTVWTRRRFWKTPQEFLSILQRTSGDALAGQINGWMIYRGRTRPVEVRGGQTFLYYSLHRIDCMGYMGVQDNGTAFSVDQFEAQVETIREGLRDNETVFGNMERTIADSEVEFSQEPYTRFEYTCWGARISFEVEALEVESLTP
jgi:hypothetical protein